MLTQRQVEEIEAYSVERERQRYSDAELSAMLDERQERMAKIARIMAKVGTLLSNDIADNEYWQEQVDKYAREYAGHLEFVDLLIWHMEKRGLTVAAKWHEGWRDFTHASALDNWRVN